MSKRNEPPKVDPKVLKDVVDKKAGYPGPGTVKPPTNQQIPTRPPKGK